MLVFHKYLKEYRDRLLHSENVVCSRQTQYRDLLLLNLRLLFHRDGYDSSIFLVNLDLALTIRPES